MFKASHLAPFFSLLRQRFSEKENQLNKLDSKIGDGDHGSTMARAFQAVERAAPEAFPDLGAGFDTASRVIAEYAGGAIGPILAAFFAEGGVVLAGKQEMGTDAFCRFLRSGVEAVRTIGEVEEGEKTLLDALQPASQACTRHTDEALSTALREATAAARRGVKQTRDMKATKGRAKNVAERSLGHQDPGATSMAIILDVLHNTLQGERAETQRPDSETEFQVPPGKLINHPVMMVREDNEGLALAYPDLVSLTEEGILLRAQPKASDKVALVIGHGGGHTPSMGGFIGPGLLDGDVYGPVFTCASGIQIAKAIAQADQGAGTILLVSNHSGDILNARLAVRRARQEGFEVTPVNLGADISTAPRERYQERRGLGGLLFALKAGGAAAEQGRHLSEVTEVMEKANRRTATLAVAVSPPTHPATGEPLFTLPERQIEIGTGVHGEMGVYRGPHLPAKEIVEMVIERLVADLRPFPTRRYLVFVNGSGGTSLMELHIVFRDAYHALLDREVTVEASVVDSFFTTQEMAGFSLSLCAADDQLLDLWHEPCRSPSFYWPREN